MVGRRSRPVSTLAVVVSLVLGLTACGGSGGSTTKTGGTTTTSARTELGPSRGADQAACVGSARAIEAAAALNYAKSGSYGTIDELVAADYLEKAPDPSWGLTIGAGGTVD